MSSEHKSGDTSTTIRVLIADDHPVVRQGLRLMIAHEPGFESAGEAASGRETLDLYFRLRPDVVIIDLRMSGMDGITAISEISSRDPAAKLIVLTNHDGDEDIFRALRAGARGYLLKGAETSEILEAIKRVHSGGKAIPADVAEKLSERVIEQSLTDREKAVLRLVARGRSNFEIGETLNISEKTVKYHVSNILSKLGVPDRTSAAVVALQRGLAHL